jgi:hypothetical protein
MKLYDRILKETQNKEYKRIIKNEKDIKEALIQYVTPTNWSSNDLNKYKLKLLELELTELSRRNKIIKINIFLNTNRNLVTVKYIEEAGHMAIFKIIDCEQWTCRQIKDKLEEYPEFELFDFVEAKQSIYNRYAILFKKL